MKPIASTLTSVSNANDRIKYYHFSFDTERDFNFIPGQFVSVMKPSEPRPIPRPYSIASTPSENSQGLLKLCVTKVPGGKVSTWLDSLEVGDEMNFKGPFGKFILPENLPKEIHFISVGTGVAPFRSMIIDLYDNGCEQEIYLYHGNRHEDSVLYDDDFRALERNYSTFHYYPCVSRPKNLENLQLTHGYVQEKVKEILYDPQDKSVYICGINNMIDEVCQILNERGFPKEIVHFERYD